MGGDIGSLKSTVRKSPPDSPPQMPRMPRNYAHDCTDEIAFIRVIYPSTGNGKSGMWVWDAPGSLWGSPTPESSEALNVCGRPTDVLSSYILQTIVINRKS